MQRASSALSEIVIRTGGSIRGGRQYSTFNDEVSSAPEETDRNTESAGTSSAAPHVADGKPVSHAR